MVELWDEIIEVDEYISVTEGLSVGKNLQNEQQQSVINLREIELILRDAALRRANSVFTEVLSNLEEARPRCPSCGENMKKKEKEPSK